MKAHRANGGFSLIEVAIAVGVAAFCLVPLLAMLSVGTGTQQGGVEQSKMNTIASEVVADLRAATRLPPGLASKQFGLKGHWAAAAQPDTIYFTNDCNQTGALNASSAPADAVFRVAVSYMLPPTQTTSLARVMVTWPAAIDPATRTPSGMIEIFAAINR